MQAFEEARRYGLDEGVGLALTDEYPLTVGGDEVFTVGVHPVEATAASYYVLARRLPQAY
jgi:hypothetical protein